MRLARDRHWASYRVDGRTFDDPAADPPPYAILQQRNGRWRMVTAGSSFDRPVPKTPPKVAADLRVRCQPALTGRPPGHAVRTAHGS
jgi:hypothetical protein